MKNLIKKNKFLVFTILAVVAIVAIFLITNFATPQYELKPIRIQQVFADVNGDGTLDLILQADVILNPMTNTFLASVPSQ